MSLIKTWLLEMQHQKDAINEARLQLLEYAMFSSLSPMNYDFNNTEETATSKEEKA